VTQSDQSDPHEECIPSVYLRHCTSAPMHFIAPTARYAYHIIVCVFIRQYVLEYCDRNLACCRKPLAIGWLIHLRVIWLACRSGNWTMMFSSSEVAYFLRQHDRTILLHRQLPVADVCVYLGKVCVICLWAMRGSLKRRLGKWTVRWIGPCFVLLQSDHVALCQTFQPFSPLWNSSVDV
jgi:hypothetical protein